MTPFEEQLKQALRRQEPSTGFTERVLAQLPQTKPLPSRWVTWRLAAAAAAALLLAGTTAYRQHERLVQGEAAKLQLMTAFRITGSKLQAAQHRINQIENSQEAQ
jgi:hypothetical protein